MHSVVVKMLDNARDTTPLTWRGHWSATPLHAACKSSHLDIAKELVKRGADVTVK